MSVAEITVFFDMDENARSNNRKEDSINALRRILHEISSSILQQGKSIVVVDTNDEYRGLVEILSLMAKHINLCKGCLSLETTVGNK